MSTKCQIGIFEKPFIKKDGKLNKPQILIYRHSNGYPKGGLLEDLTKFTNNFIENRGFDIEYLGARLLPYLISQHIGDLPTKKDRFGGYLTYGIDVPGEFHGDIEYFYAIYNDKIEVFKAKCWNDITSKSFELIETVQLK